MRFSKENQPKHHTTDERKVQFTIRLKPSTKDFYKGRRGLASKVLEEYKKQGEIDMKKQRFVVTIEMPDGDYISALYLQDLIQSDCDNIGDSYGDDIGRDKVSVTEEE